jgi:hypothetical protein
MRKITVFYAWQSDTPERFNRYLIRMALELAARKITADSELDVEMHIDADTQDVPGQPPVTETILKKIRACDIFAPDFTFVAQTDAGKFIPNPNVLVEYGYALRAKSYAAMLPIMNTAFGPPENLPFDMGHLRFPIRYFLSATAKNTERRAARKQLSENIEKALRIIVSAQMVQARQDSPFPEATAIRPPAFFFTPDQVLANAGHPGEQEFRFTFDRAIYIRLYPSHADQPSVTLAKLVQIFEARKACPMSTVIGGIPGRNAFGPIIHEPAGSKEIWALTQGFDTGELWGVNGYIFRPYASTNWRGTDEALTIIPMIAFEKIYRRVLGNYVRVAASELGLRLPYTVEMGAVGLNDVRLAFAGDGTHGQGRIEGPVMKQSLQRRYSLVATTESAMDAVLRDYFSDFYDLVAVSRRDILTDQLVAAHGLPSR